MRTALLAVALVLLPSAAWPGDSPKLKAAKATVDRELPARCERSALIRELRLHKAGTPEWLAIKRKLDASSALTDADRIARGTESIAEDLGAEETQALSGYYYDVMKRCPKD
jgi:hypothetical protein